MIDDALITDPTMRIFYARDTLFAAWQPMDKTPITLAASDFVMLSVIDNARNRSEIVRAFRARLRSLALPDCSRLHSKNRINFFKQSGILLDVQNTAETIPETPVLVDISHFGEGEAISHLLHEERLRLSHTFMLRHIHSGFQIWSSVSRSYHKLSLELVLLLVSFSSGKDVSKVMTERAHLGDTARILRAIKWLHDNGLLVTVRVDSIQENKQVMSGARVASTSDRAATPIEQPSLNGRIPIYFVPHMPNHYPLALGMLYSFIIDYKQGALLKKYMPVPIVYQNTAKDILGEPYRTYGRGVWLFSNYMWSIVSNLEISAAVKDQDQQNITIHGGPSTPDYAVACSNFMKEQKSVDIAVHGEGEITIVDLLESLSPSDKGFHHLNNVNGISFRHYSGANEGLESSQLVRTQPRARIKDLDALPSPYLTGAFDVYKGLIDAAIIESNRGCPFGCTFCDWGSATNQKIRKFDLQRVRDEIEWIGENQVRVLWVADANFGIYERDIEIAKWICHVKEKYGYPKEIVVNYTKNATKRLAKIVELFAANGICSQGVISIQTRDQSTLAVINRKNIKTDKYDDLAEIFRLEGLPLSTDLMIGLPGMTVASFKEDLQYFFDMDVTVKAYPTELLPNSPMADPDYIEKYKIEVDENNFLVSTFSYSRNDYHDMNVIFYLFTVADTFSTLRYVLRYLSWDHGVMALDFLHKLHKAIENDPYRYPTIAYMSKVFQIYMNVPGGWHQFYDEIAEFTEASYGVQRDSGFNAVLYFNEMVMPDDALSYPLNIQLDHDVLAYFMEHRLQHAQGTNPLDTYPSMRTAIEDQYSYGHINYNSKQYDSHQIFWELQTPASRTQSVPNFM
jgi:radical SAM superfamily enzyme YgiQ (UPF0313 family)